LRLKQFKILWRARHTRNGLCSWLIESLKQGHRRYHSPELREELIALKTEVWRKYRRMKIGTPMEKDRSLPCNVESPSANC
jgi:hypothetical protein